MRMLPGFLVSLLIVLGSCREPETGLDVLNPNDAIELKLDTSQLVWSSQGFEDSVRTDELTSNLLGTCHDPLIGTVKAEVYTQFRVAVSSSDFGSNPRPDSLVLSLKYRGAYGDVTAQNGVQKFQVYRLTESISLPSTYYSNDSLQYEPDPIGETGFIAPRLEDSINVFGRKQAPQLRIHLSPGLAQEFMDNRDKLTTSEAFLDFFKGVMIRSVTPDQSPGTGAILDFNLIGGANLEFYFSNDTSTTNSLLTVFVVNQNCARFNRFIHKYPEEIFAMAQSPALAQDHVFSSAMAGLRARVDFPSLASWKGNRNILVSQARLIVPVDPEYIGKYPVNAKLDLVTKSDAGQLLNSPDMLAGSDYAGGTFDNKLNQYSFNVTKYVQAQLNGKPNNGLFLQAVGTGVSSFRVRMNGGGHPQKPMKLELLYQILPQ